MAQQRLVFRPGINSLATPTLNEGGWSEDNLIRWREGGYMEKLGGWQRITNDLLTGVCRSLHSFHDLDGIEYIACGTNRRLELWDAGSGLTNITPIASTADLLNPFSTTNLLTTVGVNDVSHGGHTGDEILVTMPIAVGGIVLHGLYEITVIDADNYTITAASAATSTVAAGGTPPVFDTTNTLTTVLVTLINHGYVVGDIFSVEISTTVGGLTLTGDYLVATTPTANTFTIESASAATSTATATENSGNSRIEYYLAAGNESTTIASGWGTGPYGMGPYGSSSGGSYRRYLRIWSLDNFGEILLAQVTQGALYAWTPPKGVGNNAVLVATAPTINQAMFVAMPQAQVIVLGAETGGFQDPLLIRFSNVGSYSNFTATVTNQAGSVRLSRGSLIVGGLSGAFGALIWTDQDLWQMVYQGLPFVYDTNVVGSNCGLLAQNAACTQGDDVYWMSQLGFFRYGSTPVSRIPCPVWDDIFGILDRDNADKCIAASNTSYNEIAWFFPSIYGDGEIDMYVKVTNPATGEPIWDYGTLVRTAWIDHGISDTGAGGGFPVAVDANGRLQQHEVGYDADDVAMTGVYGTTGYLDIEEGQDFSFVNQMIPDFKWFGTSPAVLITVYTLNEPGGTAVTHGPFTANATKKIISNLRGRGRQIAFKYAMDGADMSFRVGATRVKASPAGSVGGGL